MTVCALMLLNFLHSILRGHLNGLTDIGSLTHNDQGLGVIYYQTEPQIQIVKSQKMS